MILRAFLVLNNRHRRQFVILVLCFLVSGLVQVAGVTSIAPFIALIGNPELIHRNTFASKVYAMSGSSSDSDFLVFFAVALMLLAVLSNAILAGSAWLIAEYGVRVHASLQKDVFRGIWRRSYAEFSRSNSAELITIVTSETNRYLYMVLLPLLNFLSQACVVFFIVAGLFLYNPSVAVVATLILGVGYLSVFSIVRDRLAHYGRIAWTHNSQKQQLLSESLGGFKEITLAGVSDRYEVELDRVSKHGMRSNVMANLLTDLPRFGLEALAFCSMLGLGVYLLLTLSDKSVIIGVLGLYALAGYRLMPAAQTLFKTAGSIRGNLDAIANLQQDLDAGRRADKAFPESRPILSVEHPIHFENVSFRYPGSDSLVLDSVSFRIPPRSLTVLVGESGAGKSTAADILLGLLQPVSGTVLHGQDPIATSDRAWQRSLGYVPQSIFLFDQSIEANIRFGSSLPSNNAKLAQAIRSASLETLVKALPDGIETRVGERGSLLSGGQRQRIGIARAMYNDAVLLVMDEATSALDASTEREVLRTLLELAADKPIVMIAHRLSAIAAAQHVVMFEKGRIIDEGTFEDVSRRCTQFKQMIGTLEADSNGTHSS